ncbi:uncharacterized protein LOC118406873 [Branchiostoma floridae]|uniref:Uncharacterized protein LOC118406873 n=1 Tax=Branchiostoma floridae TaxID=7739 RepID=A0A9J7KHE1_BRAFL|nr:uncharacterized protein LOC118406873 [Branchiostoma floridae]
MSHERTANKHRLRSCPRLSYTDDDTEKKETAIVVTCCDFNDHMDHIIVLMKEDGQLTPRRIRKTILTPGGERIPEDQRQPVGEIINAVLKGIPGNYLEPLPLVRDTIDEQPTNGERSDSSEDSEGSTSDEEALSGTVSSLSSSRGTSQESESVSSLEAVCAELAASPVADAEQIPVAGSNEVSVCAAVVPFFSAEIMGIALTTMYRHRHSRCDESNVLCWICLNVLGMLIHMFGCICELCPLRQLISQGFAQHVRARRCESITCSIPWCEGTQAIVRNEDSLYPSSHLIRCVLQNIRTSFEAGSTNEDRKKAGVPPSTVSDAVVRPKQRSLTGQPQATHSEEDSLEKTGSTDDETAPLLQRDTRGPEIRSPRDPVFQDGLEGPPEDDEHIPDIEEMARTAMVRVPSDELSFLVQASAHDSDGLEALGAVGGRSESFSPLPTSDVESDAESSLGNKAYERKVRVAIRDSVAKSLFTGLAHHLSNPAGPGPDWVPLARAAGITGPEIDHIINEAAQDLDKDIRKMIERYAEGRTSDRPISELYMELITRKRQELYHRFRRDPQSP